MRDDTKSSAIDCRRLPVDANRSGSFLEKKAKLWRRRLWASESGVSGVGRKTKEGRVNRGKIWLASYCRYYYYYCRYINVLRSRLLRRTCLAYPPVSQPFSARNGRRGSYLLGKPPELNAFFDLWRSFFLFFPPFCLNFVVSFICLTETAFPLSVHVLFCFRRVLFSHLFVFCGTFFCTYDVRVSIFEHVVTEHNQISTHSTVQHSVVNPRNKEQSKHGPIRARQRRQADGVSSRQQVVEHIYYTSYIHSSLCSQNEERNRTLLGPQKYCRWCDARRVYLYTALSLRPSYFVHTCGVRIVWGTMELLAFASRYLVLSLRRKPTSPCDSFIRIMFNSSLWAGVTGGGSRPRSEAPCTYMPWYYTVFNNTTE